jgi:hypothetical protein
LQPVEVLAAPKIQLQRGKESFLDLSQSWITGDRLASEREASADQSFPPHHLAGDIVIAATVGYAAADHLASVVEDDSLSGSRAEVNADIGP